MKNKMEEVAKLLDVELGEEFEIKGVGFNPYTLTRHGLYDRNNDMTRFLLQQLLFGEVEIIRKLLTKEEKEYLESVFRPYKNNVEEIVMMYICGERFLRIVIKRGMFKEEIDLPYIIEDDLQFKGLENGNRYTKEELNLFEGED